MPDWKVVGECGGCHKEKEIVNVTSSGDIFCRECMHQYPEDKWHKPRIEW